METNLGVQLSLHLLAKGFAVRASMCSTADEQFKVGNHNQAQQEEGHRQKRSILATEQQ